MSYRERYAEIVKAGRRESKNIGQKAQNAVIDTFALMDDADATIAALEDDLADIAAIIESVDMRAAATDGPVTPTLQEMTQEEIGRIYAIAAKRGRRGKSNG